MPRRINQPSRLYRGIRAESQRSSLQTSVVKHGVRMDELFDQMQKTEESSETRCLGAACSIFERATTICQALGVEAPVGDVCKAVKISRER